MLRFHNVAYAHPGGHVQFTDISFTLQPHQKVALTGNNGSGKSTLLRVAAGELAPTSGVVDAAFPPYYIPQVVGQYDHLTVAHALRAHDKLAALAAILAGDVADQHLTTLADDWTIEERCTEALAHWQLPGVALHTVLGSLSGGQKTRVFLAGLHVHTPQLILLDEPTNHLDGAGRELLYSYISTTRAAMIIVSHDRQLLRLPDTIYELADGSISRFGGNYDFYLYEKQVMQEALAHDIHSTEKALRKAREAARETMERQQRQDARGKKKQQQAGVPKIMMNTLRNTAENSTARAKGIHTEKITGIADELHTLRSGQPANDKMRLHFDDSALHRGKILFSATGINVELGGHALWPQPLHMQLTSGDRLALTGLNGSGKSTLIRVMLGQLIPTMGTVSSAIQHAVYIDQDYSLLSNELTVAQQAGIFNTQGLTEAEVNSRLTHFLFTKDTWHKPCSALSGGERMKLTLCCLMLSNHQPDLLILDEPTNNLDLKNVEILTDAIKHYNGTLIVVSHDQQFINETGITREIALLGTNPGGIP